MNNPGRSPEPETQLLVQTPKESNVNNPGRSPVVTKKSNPNPEGVEYENI